MTTENNLGSRGGDFLIHIESEQKCLVGGQLTAPASPASLDLENVTAYPLLAGNVLAVATDEASVVAFAIWGNPISGLLADADTAAIPEYTIIDVFDGAVLNKNAIPAKDFAGAEFTLATIVGAAGLSAVKWVAEPVKTSTQTN